MPQRVVDSRSREAAYATKPNIVPQVVGEGGIRRLGGSGTLGNTDFDPRIDLAINDASVAASTVFLDDTSAQSSDTGPLPAGTYEVYLKLRIPTTAAANTSAILQHRNAANAATQRTIDTILADGPTGAVRQSKYTGITLAAGERLRVVAGSAGVHTSNYVEFRVTKVD